MPGPENDRGPDNETGNDNWFDPGLTTFGDRLAGARETAGMTQEELAQNLGVRLTTIEDWENDVSEPRSNRMSMMAGVMNVSLSWLLTGKGDGPSEPQTSMGKTQILTELRNIRARMLTSLEQLGRLEDMLADDVDGPR